MRRTEGKGERNEAELERRVQVSFWRVFRHGGGEFLFFLASRQRPLSILGDWLDEP
jgi:hypothetical protein